MNYAEMKTLDIANGPGIRVSVFVSGCRLHCKGCFNYIAWDFQYGKPVDQTMLDNLVNHLNQDMIQGLTILGGEPLDPLNQPGVLEMLRQVRERCPGKNIWCYTGYVFEKDIQGWMLQETDEIKEILSLIDVLVDGPFEESQKDISLQFRGSRNQRLINIPETLEQGQIVLWKNK